MKMKSPRFVAVLTVAAALLALGAPLRAQETPHQGAAAESHEAHGEGHEHANELAVFLGGTSEGDETHFTIGAEYERRLGERLGLAFVAEHIGGIDAWVFVAPFTFRPVRNLGLKLYAGPGFESKEPELAAEHAPSAHSAEEEGGRETFFVFRTGIGWAVELGRVSLTPQVEADFAREHGEWQTALVFGVAVGLGF